MSGAMRMPAEWAPHERTIMCWPARSDLYGDAAEFAAAKAEHAGVANAIADFEPVTLAAHPSQEAEARAAVSGAVEVVAIPIDDAWARDSGPIFVIDSAPATHPHPRRAGVHFGFNAWGEKFAPYEDDAAFGARVIERVGDERIDATDFVLEGGSVAVDGEGTLVTTEQCLLNPNRNPSLDRDAIEARLREHLGVERIVWLGNGLVEDDDTDGHVDNIFAFVEPGRALLQTVGSEDDPNFAFCRENAERLRAAGIDVVEISALPRLEGAPEPTVVPYVNYYVANGALIVPVTGAETDDPALGLLASLYPGRQAVPVSGTTLALGGGGVHCITQQVPAARGS